MLKNSPPRKRLPIEQLKNAARVANELLVKKHIMHKDNMLERIARDPRAPLLPGLPPYLPHKFTIDAARQAIFIILREWADKHKGDEDKQENASLFFYFVVKRMSLEERKFKSQMKQVKRNAQAKKDEGLTLYQIFSPMKRYQHTIALNKFFVDSFAVFVIVKGKSSTTEYAEWFLGEWTPSLMLLWKTPDAKPDIKGV
jgi:hypothetical protein